MTKLLKLAKETFGSSVVLDVADTLATNRDGQSVRQVQLVYEAGSVLSIDDMKHFIELLWTRERSSGHDAFPVVSYVSSSEIETMHAAE